MFVSTLIEMTVRTGGHVILSWQRPMPPAVVETSLRALARVHAWGWGGRGLPPTHWTPLMVTTNATSVHFIFLMKKNSNFKNGGTKYLNGCDDC